MELSNPYLVGAVSLLESLGKKIIVQLRDDEAIERIFVDKYYGDIPRGVYLIRGENVILAAEIDESKKVNLEEVDPTLILTMCDEKIEETRIEYERRAKLLGEKGILIGEQQIRGKELMLENMY
ncbi:U6 snRNA-associated Sm-like protein LSm1 [Strongyloides ratti]|uniref:U6 snRNA-associated Sm-like protein LSm1 n=1 Tax=Strongyloides ratti TaxID=34506 RepID=A0A090MYC8_STRRB|nr:U6 snRNA-associated Sm-like protein LSm1 [Strongyloides ratti]CEF66959.1 U6 snRNA-associated Sm-like protein LSm1 [Strongyloides ratti]